jgi:hypothetical protein
MAYRINHIHLKAPDPRKTAEWYLGPTLLEGPIQNPNGSRIAFLRAPDDVRVDLVEPREAGIAGGGC